MATVIQEAPHRAVAPRGAIRDDPGHPSLLICLAREHRSRDKPESPGFPGLSGSPLSAERSVWRSRSRLVTRTITGQCEERRRLPEHASGFSVVSASSAALLGHPFEKSQNSRRNQIVNLFLLVRGIVVHLERSGSFRQFPAFSVLQAVEILRNEQPSKPRTSDPPQEPGSEPPPYLTTIAPLLHPPSGDLSSWTADTSSSPRR